MGRIALILCMLVPCGVSAQELTPLHTGLTPKPAWEVCGNFACYTKDEQLKVLRMRSHYEAVFTYAVALEREIDVLTKMKLFYEDQHALQKEQLILAQALLNDQREESIKQIDMLKKDHTLDLIMYTGAGALVGAALTYFVVSLSK